MLVVWQLIMCVFRSSECICSVSTDHCRIHWISLSVNVTGWITGSGFDLAWLSSLFQAPLSLWRCVNIFTELSLAGLAVDLVDIECYDAMGSVIRPLKLYPKWSIMCRVGHCTIPVLLVVVHHYNVLIVMLPHINQSISLYFSQICNNNDNSCTKYRVHIHIHSYAINISFVDLMSVLWISVLLTQTSSIGNVITVCSAFNIQQFLCQ